MTLKKIANQYTSGILIPYSIFDLYQSKNLGKVDFDTFYAAFLVFKELGLISVQSDAPFEIVEHTNVKKSLTESQLYNKLLLFKNTMGA